MALAAAEQIVTEQGSKALTARKVAAAIGYTVGTLYLVFSNLDDLVLHVNARTLDELFAHIDRMEVPVTDRNRYLKAVSLAYLQFATTHPHRWALVFDRRGDDSKPLPDWYKEKVANLFQLVERALQAFPQCRTPEKLFLNSRALWGAVHGVCQLSLAQKWDVVGVDSVEKMVETLVDNFIRGLEAGA